MFLPQEPYDDRLRMIHGTLNHLAIQIIMNEQMAESLTSGYPGENQERKI